MGSEELTIEDIAELSISDNVNNTTLFHSNNDEEVIPLSGNTIMKGLQVANKLGLLFLTNDDNVIHDTLSSDRSDFPVRKNNRKRKSSLSSSYTE